MIKRSILAAVVFSCFANFDLSAQSLVLTSSDSAAIARAVVIYAQKDMAMKGSLLIAPEYRWQAGNRDSTETVKLGQAIGARFATRQQVVSCESARCQMSPGVTLVTVSQVKVVNDTALVHISVTRSSKVPGLPVAGREHIYEILKENGRWTVIRLRAAMIS